MSNRTYTSALNDGKGAPAFMYIYDSSLITTGAGRLYTGANRLYTTADISNSTVNVSGLNVSVGAVAVTGIVPITVANPVLAISGNSTILNTAPIPFSGIAVVDQSSVVSAVASGNGLLTGIDRKLAGVLSAFITGGTLNVSVTGGVLTSSSSSTFLTGNNLVGITGGTLNVAVTGGVLSSSSSSIALTGFSPTLPPLPVTGSLTVAAAPIQAISGNATIINTAPIAISGAVNATFGSANVTVTGFPATIAPLAISGIVTASVSTVDTGNRSVNLVTFSPTLAPLPVSGSFTSTPGNTAVTGGLIGTIDTGNRSVFVVNQAMVNSGGWSAVTGVVATVNSGGYIAVTGIPTVSIVSSITQATFVSGGFIAITGDQRGVVISGGFIAITGTPNVNNLGGYLGLTGVAAVVNSGGFIGVTGTVSINALGGFIGITGAAQTNDTTGNLFLASISGSLVSLLADNVAITGFSSTIAPLAVTGVFTASIGAVAITGQVSTVDTIGNQLLSGVTGQLYGISGQLAANLAGSAPISGDVRNIPGTVLAVSGTMVIPFTSPVYVTGSFSSTVTNPLGVTGTARDVNPIYSGVNTYNFLPIGGRAVAATGVGSVTGYSSGAFVMMNFDANNGALMVEQGISDKNYDSIQVFTAGSGLALASGITGSTGSAGINFGVVLNANPSRLGWGIQALGTGAIMLAFSSNIASTGNLNMILKGCSSSFAGDGASFVDMPAIWKGPVSVSGFNGAMALYTKWEI